MNISAIQNQNYSFQASKNAKKMGAQTKEAELGKKLDVVAK